MAGGSTKVIVISLAANFGIALSKLGGAFVTGSASLLAEAVHSFSDCGNQLLLLHGQRVAKKGSSPQYPLGRGKEMFFWSFVVALLLFSMGGIFSLYEGIHKVHSTEGLSHPHIGVAILVVAVILEGFSFWACYKEVREHNTHGSLWQWVQHTSSTDLLVIFLEDLAALLGLVIALAALLATWATANPLWDGIGSIGIGILLVGVAIVLAREVKPMLIGQMPAFDYRSKLETLLSTEMPGAKMLTFLAIQQGVQAVLVAYKIDPGKGQDLYVTIDRVNRFERKVKEAYPEIQWQFAELDTAD